MTKSAEMILERFCCADFGTFGRLFVPGYSCYTVERPWLENRPWVSCIPCGTYGVEAQRYNRGGYETCGLMDVPNRTHILIHRGNLPTDVQGCIAVGTDVGCVNGKWAVTGSAAAFEELWAVVEALLPGTLEIMKR